MGTFLSPARMNIRDEYPASLTLFLDFILAIGYLEGGAVLIIVIWLNYCCLNRPDR